MNVEVVVSAIAATVAAVLAGLNLWVGGKREDRQWRRGAAVDAIVGFLEASYAMSMACHEAHVERTAGKDLRDITTYSDRTKRTHDEQVRYLTRLLVLATGDVVLAAERIHVIDHDLVDTTFGSRLAERAQFDAVYELLHPARHELVDAARRHLQVRGVVRLSFPRRWWEAAPRETTVRDSATT